MDVCNNEPPGALAQEKTVPEDTPRPPLVPSEKNNAVLAARKPRTREITSRYKSGITPTPLSIPSAPRRSPSPNVSRTSSSPGTSLPKRAQSADRRRPSTPSSRPSAPSSPSSRPSTPSSPSSRSTTPTRDSVTETQSSSRRLLGSRTPDGLWPSMRSLSSSFQSDSSSIPARRDRAVANSSSDQTLKPSANAVPERKRTPLRGRSTSDQSENSRPVENSHVRMVDQLRWPGVMGGRVSGNSMSRSMDLTDKVNKSASLSIPARGTSPSRRMPISGGAGNGLQKSTSDVAMRVSFDANGRIQRETGAGISAPLNSSGRGSSTTRRVSPSRRIPISDGAGKGLQKSNSDVVRRLSLDGSGRIEREMGTGINISLNPSERAPLITRPSRTQSSPLHRPSSPNKVSSTSSSTSRGMQSPSRTRPSTPFSSSGSATSRAGISSSVLNYIADVRNGKKSSNHMEDAHQLRLLYNGDLQWRFVNARSDAALSIQKMIAENILCAVWNTTSELRETVIMKRTDMQQLRQEMKLDIVLKEQMAYLEDWAELEREHSISLLGAIEALKASTVRLPVTCGARADLRVVKNAVSSAVDVMQAMGSSICYLLSRVEGTNCLVSELSDVTAKERAMLDECRELLASAAAMQVQESSIRTHLIQRRQDVHKM